MMKRKMTILAHWSIFGAALQFALHVIVASRLLVEKIRVSTLF